MGKYSRHRPEPMDAWDDGHVTSIDILKNKLSQRCNCGDDHYNELMGVWSNIVYDIQQILPSYAEELQKNTNMPVTPRPQAPSTSHDHQTKSPSMSHDHQRPSHQSSSPLTSRDHPRSPAQSSPLQSRENLRSPAQSPVMSHVHQHSDQSSITSSDHRSPRPPYVHQHSNPSPLASHVNQRSPVQSLVASHDHQRSNSSPLASHVDRRSPAQSPVMLHHRSDQESQDDIKSPVQSHIPLNSPDASNVKSSSDMSHMRSPLMSPVTSRAPSHVTPLHGSPAPTKSPEPSAQGNPKTPDEVLFKMFGRGRGRFAQHTTP